MCDFNDNNCLHSNEMKFYNFELDRLDLHGSDAISRTIYFEKETRVTKYRVQMQSFEMTWLDYEYRENYILIWTSIPYGYFCLRSRGFNGGWKFQVSLSRTWIPSRNSNINRLLLFLDLQSYHSSVLCWMRSTWICRCTFKMVPDRLDKDYNYVDGVKCTWCSSVGVRVLVTI